MTIFLKSPEKCSKTQWSIIIWNVWHKCVIIIIINAGQMTHLYCLCRLMPWQIKQLGKDMKALIFMRMSSFSLSELKISMLWDKVCRKWLNVSTECKKSAMLEIIFCLLARGAGVGRAKRELGSKNAAGWGGVGGRWGKKRGGWGRRVAEAFNKGMFGQPLG